MPAALPLLLTLLLVALATGTVRGWRPGLAAPDGTGELRVVTTDWISSLDPRHSRALPAMENRLVEAMWDPLLVVDRARIAVSPSVAVRWELLPDGLTLRLHLDPTARWSNGERVTAHDFLRTLELHRELDAAHPFALLLGGSTDPAALRSAARARDESTLEFTVPAPLPDLAARLAAARWLPTHASAPAAFERGGLPSGPLITNGPYFYAGEERGEHLLQRNPHYPTKAGAPGRLRVLTTSGPTLYPALLRSGRAHLADQTGPSYLRGWETPPGLVREVETTASISMVQFNPSRAPLSDPRVRRALSLALDRAELAEGFGSGALPAYSFVPPSGRPDETPRTITENRAEAHRLLAAAGYPGGVGFPVLRFPVVVGEGLANPLAWRCAEQWRERLGVRIYVVPVDRRELMQRAERGDFDLIHVRWAAQAFDVSLLAGQLQDDLPTPFRAWSTEKVAEALDRADRLGGELRQAALIEVERALVDEIPATPTVVYRRATLRHERVRGWQPDIFGLHSLRDLSLAGPGGSDE